MEPSACPCPADQQSGEGVAKRAHFALLRTELYDAYKNFR
jgi:hypothetical protein